MFLPSLGPLFRVSPASAGLCLEPLLASKQRPALCDDGSIRPQPAPNACLRRPGLRTRNLIDGGRRRRLSGAAGPRVKLSHRVGSPCPSHHDSDGFADQWIKMTPGASSLFDRRPVTSPSQFPYQSIRSVRVYALLSYQSILFDPQSPLRVIHDPYVASSVSHCPSHLSRRVIVFNRQDKPCMVCI